MLYYFFQAEQRWGWITVGLPVFHVPNRERATHRHTTDGMSVQAQPK